MRCPACRADNRPGVKFCEECGARLDATCPACGASVPPDKKFCGACGAALAPAPATAAGSLPDRFATPKAYTPAHLAERILKDGAALSGERKQVTVLFADVSGFTSLSEALDPEDVHALISRAFELMLAEVHRYEGTVNQFLGDGLMALFGAPIAHEDHARRAAQAALAMQQALAAYRDELAATRRIDFRVRMGLNTGLVVVGAIGDNLRMDYTAVGDTTNTAARMQQLAQPGQIVVAEATERLIRAWFETRALGAIPVKGKSQPVAAYELGRPKEGVTRLEARAARGLSPFVGRADALATLERAFAATHAGRGQAVFVVGEAGMGKSRLLLEFHRRVADQALWAEGECVSFGQSTPYFAVINLLKRTFGVGDRDGEAAIVEKIQRGLAAACPDAPEIAPYLRYLLAVDPGDPTLAGMDPAQRQQGIVAAVQRCAAEASRRRPLVLVIEDLHWIDGASEDYLKRFVESLPGMAVLLILTWRPVYPQPFGDRTYYWRIGLQSLDDEDAFRIVSAALATEELPRELAAVVARKAEGNPFFLEELGRTLAETGAVRVEAGRVLVAQPAAALAVPDTVQDVIAARLDRLEEAQKRTVQTASVIGREFALALLRRVSDVQDQLDRSLAELRHVELIYEKAGFGSAEYVFRHALTQDVAYASLLVAERRRLHGLIGAAIEDVYAGRLEERAEELVYHFTRGEVWDKVARYARDAAERAAGLFVDARAVEFYELALEALHRLPETRETARAGIEIRLGMRPPLWRAGKLEPLFERMTEAEALATRHGESEPLDTIFSFLVQYHWAKGDQERALEYGRRCLEIADAKDDLGLRVTAHFYMCHSDEALGRFTEGLHHAQAIVDLLEGPRERERFGLSGLPYCGACAMAAWSVSELGDPEGGLDFIRRGRRVADAANHLYSQAVLATCEGYVLVDHRTPGEAIAVLEPAVKICREKGFVGWLMLAVAALARAYARAGRAEDAIRLAKEGVALQEGTGATVNRAYLHLNVAWACLAAGRLDEAEAAVATALEFAGRQGERAWQAWGAFILGETARARGDRAAAAQRYDEAQELAEELAMRPLVERCRAALRTLG